MKIKKSVQSAMKRLQVDTLRKSQIKPIDSVLQGRDTFVIAPTGAGKSLMYQIPAVMCEGQLTLVIEPTLALMHDQVQKMKGKGIPAAYLDSTLTKSETANILHRVRQGEIQILYITPERLKSSRFLEAIADRTIYMVVVDECHCVLEWGESFRPDYLKIGAFISSREHRPIVMALTATAKPDDRLRIMELLQMQRVQSYVLSIDRPKLILLKQHCETLNEKLSALKKAIRKYHKNGSIIVYCSTCAYVDAVYNHLSKRYPDQIVRCHSTMNEKTRASHERAFLDNEKSIMIATSAFGMGVDKGDIDLIVHFNMPFSIGEYYQQAGRAGRDGRKAHCVLLYNQGDVAIGRALAKKLEKPAKDQMLTRLRYMEKFTKSKACMMQDVLGYFGEAKEKSCKHCTECQRSRRA